MLIRNPINPYPQNITVDPTKTKISFTFMGDRLGSYQIKIYSYTNDVESTENIYSLVYESNVVDVDNYAFNNTPITFDLLMSEMKTESNQPSITTLDNTHNAYTWEVIMSSEKPNNEGGFIEGTTFASLRYFFQTTPTPKIVPSPNATNAGFKINEVVYSYDELKQVKATNKNLNIEAYYYNGNIKYYYFQLFDENNNMIEETKKIFSSKIDYNFSGLLSGKDYYLYFNSVSQDEQYITIPIKISTDYQEKQDLSNPPILTVNNEEANVKIKWKKDSTATGKATGTYNINASIGEEDTGTVDIETGSIIFDNISSSPIQMDKNNFAVGIKTTVNDTTTKILDYINNDALYEIYVENYKIYLKYGDINSPTKIVEEIIAYADRVEFGIQKNEAEDNVGYMWYVGDEYEIPYAEEDYLLVSNIEPKKYSILLQNKEGIVSCDIQEITGA